MVVSKTCLYITLFTAAVFLVVNASGCSPEPSTTGLEEVRVIEAEGILAGQIDNYLVEIEVAGGPIVFRLSEGVVVAGIAEGSRVEITYAEADASEPENAAANRPLLLSIKSIDFTGEVIEASGNYIGQVDSHSVEIEIEGKAQVFALGRVIIPGELESGAEVFITYRQDGERQLLLTIVPAVGLVDDGNDLLVGEGVLTGMIDAQSVEIMINRAFMLDQGVSAEEIADGSLVAFTFRESGLRAVIVSIKAVEQPLEGAIMHGRLIGQIDSQSVEIEYFQAFALGSGVSADGIPDGTEVVFTYIEGEYRPVLTSIKIK